MCLPFFLPSETCLLLTKNPKSNLTLCLTIPGTSPSQHGTVSSSPPLLLLPPPLTKPTAGTQNRFFHSGLDQRCVGHRLRSRVCNVCALRYNTRRASTVTASRHQDPWTSVISSLGTYTAVRGRDRHTPLSRPPTCPHHYIEQPCTPTSLSSSPIQRSRLRTLSEKLQQLAPSCPILHYAHPHARTLD